MNFTLTYSNRYDCGKIIPDEQIKISSLEELKELQDKHWHQLIINFNDMTIEIYNGYRE